MSFRVDMKVHGGEWETVDAFASEASAMERARECQNLFAGQVRVVNEDEALAVACDRMTNIDSREGFVGFDRIDEFDGLPNSALLSDDVFIDDDGDMMFEDDGQPDEYTEWQDLNGGDDWDHGQFDGNGFFDE